MKVAVVGAGISGLRAAHLLEANGDDVTVFEARSRVGGRLHTVEVGDGFYEAGGEWIDADHDRVIGLLREFGLVPERSDARPRRLHFCGQDAWSDDGWPSASEATKALWEAVPKIRAGLTPFESLGDVLDFVCADEVARAYCEAVARSDEGTDSARVGARTWAEFYSVYDQRSEENEEMSAFRFPGGGQSLCTLIAAKLAVPIKHDCTLKSVSLIDDVLSLRFENGTEYGCDACVIAIPPTCLAEVSLPMAVSPGAGFEMSPTRKVVLRFSRPFWEDSGWGGHLMSDLVVQQVWPGGRNGLYALTCYINGASALGLQGGENAVRECLESLAELFPQAVELFVEGWLHDWSAEQFSKGGFPLVPPGAAVGALPSGNGAKVYFAGDWTAKWAGFIEGALESAERVVEEVARARSLL